MTPRSLLLCALLLNGSAAAFGQAQEPATVGPPELRNFELPGTRTTPPATAPEPPPAATIRPTPTPSPTSSPPRSAPERREQAATPPPRVTPPANREQSPATANERPPREVPSRSPAEPAPAAPALATTPAATPPSAASPVPAADPVPDFVPPVAEPVQEAMQPEPEESGGNLPWLLIGLILLLGLGGVLALRRKRTAAPAAAMPVPVAAPKAPPAAPPQPEPRIEIDFHPERVVISAEKAEVHFRLDIRNVGAVATDDARIAVRVFNAADERAIADFFSEDRMTEAPLTWRMPAGYRETLEAAAALPQAEIRPVEVQGRRLFIPVVAFSLVWWLEDGRTGQTAVSFLVGRETDPPAEKMGAFRLDLGPRLYRTVGRRPNRPAAPKPPKKVLVRIEA